MPVASVEIWGGVECTCRRVGEAYSDQLVRSGHRYRLDDLDRFAAFGLARYARMVAEPYPWVNYLSAYYWVQ